MVDSVKARVEQYFVANFARLKTQTSIIPAVCLQRPLPLSARPARGLSARPAVCRRRELRLVSRSLAATANLQGRAPIGSGSAARQPLGGGDGNGSGKSARSAAGRLRQARLVSRS